MMYVVYDESGRITQGSQLYHHDYAGTEKIMHDLGQRFFKERRTLVSPDECYVALKERYAGLPRPKLRMRSEMPITVSTTTIRAGTNDAAIFRNIPKGAQCTISAAGSSLYDIVMQDDELELGIPVPCTYWVKFSLWPRRDAVFEIKAVAS